MSYCAIVELVRKKSVPGRPDHVGCAFGSPKKYRWLATLDSIKIRASLFVKFRAVGVRFVSRVVTEERAEYLFMSYKEFVSRLAMACAE